MLSVNRIWPFLPELDLFQEAEAKPDTPVVAVVVKGDVDGSVEVPLFVSHTILTIFSFIIPDCFVLIFLLLLHCSFSPPRPFFHASTPIALKMCSLT